MIARMRTFLLVVTLAIGVPGFGMTRKSGNEGDSHASYLQIVCQKYSLIHSGLAHSLLGSLDSPMPESYRDIRGRIWRATAHGLAEINPKRRERSLLNGKDGLPILSLTGIAGGAGDWLWLASDQGVTLFLPNAAAGHRWFYFWGKRYLSDNHVLQIVAGVHQAWIRTRTGISHIEFKPFTLEQKSALFLRRVRERHDRYGYVSDCQLLRPGDTMMFRMEPTDNDGLWTSIFVAAESFHYATTHSKQALRNARASLTALLRLDSITGIRGYPARALIHRGDYVPPGGVWHWSRNGKWEWKGDTSSDELVGHFFAYWVAYHLLPDNGDRAVIRRHVSSIAGGLLKHHLDLVGYGGRITTWGRYDPGYLKTLDTRDRALNALELLSHLRVAFAITRQKRFLRAYRRMGGPSGYVHDLMRIGDDSHPASINYSDEELAFLSFYPLLHAARDPQLVRQYRVALTRLWNRVRAEHNPLWDFIYQQGIGKRDSECVEALETLQRIPLSTISWTVDNSQRHDLKLAAHPGRYGETQSSTEITPNERQVMKWNGDPFQLNGGEGGRTEDDGSFFLLPYWFGRYYHLIPCSG
jgi:hypothetical protein